LELDYDGGGRRSVLVQQYIHCRGTYTLPAPVSGPGLGTLVLPLTTGSINFNLVVPSNDGKSVDAIQSDTGSLVAGTTFCTTTPTTMALRGHLTRVDGGGDGGSGD